jgi:translation initiation factor 2 subunit 2
MAPANDDSKVTAESHAPTTPPLSEALNSFTDAKPTAEDGAAADDGGLDMTLKKKKKKKVVAEGADDGADAAPAAEDGGLDLSMKKKKKKKVPVADDDFAAKLKALEVDGGEEGDAAAAATAGEAKEDEGDMLEGTGIWARDESRPIQYDLLLNRFFYLLSQKNPDHALGGTKSKIPPPQCLREGNKKTIFANIAEICRRMKRSEEHMMAYLFAEMGTSGSVDGSQRLVIKGKFQQKQIENLLRKYISEWRGAHGPGAGRLLLGPSLVSVVVMASADSIIKSSTSRARRASPATRSCPRARTGCTLSPAM